MNILFIGFVWPEPTSSAAGQNILSLIKACSENNWKVSFACAAEQNQSSYPLAELEVNTHQISLNCSSFDSLLEKLQADIVVFDRFLSFEQFAARVKSTLPSALLVLDTEDLHGLREARRLYLKDNLNSESFANSTDIFSYPKYLYNDVMLRELACIYQADLSIVLSEFEEDILVSHFHLNRNQVCRLSFILFGDKNIRTNIAKSYEQKQDFIFIGNFRHAPNADAVRFLREKCWPKIKAHLHKTTAYQNAACHIYGAYLPSKIKNLESPKLDFYVHGHAKGQFEVINKAKVMLAPIRFGAGVKGKLLDAMQSNTPSVSTALGAEGIVDINAIHEQWPGKISHDIKAFINDAVELYTNENQWQTAVKQGQTIIDKKHDNSLNSKNLIKVIERAKSKQASMRETNFFQQLLNRQAFNASKYMSQWIEAKNRI